MTRNRTVVLVTNIPNPYRVALFNELDRQLKAAGLHLLVLFGAPTYARRKFILDPADMHFAHEYLSSRTFHFGNNEKTFFTYGRLLRRVRRYAPVAVVVNGFSLAALKIRLYRLFRRLPYLVWTGSVAGRNDSFPRKAMRRFILRKAAACIAYGTRSRAYLVGMGMRAERVYLGINTVDTAFFARETERLRGTAAAGPRHLTVVGYLVPRKQTVRVLEAVRLLASQRDDFVLDIVGDGGDRPHLEDFVRTHGLAERVVFHGFRQRNELPLYLAQSAGFLFQTDFDIWGLVLNEAMAAGLPCLASPNAAATDDLVQDGETGYVVDFSQAEKAAGRMAWLLDHPDHGREMGRRAAAFVADHASIEVSARGFRDAIVNSATA